MLSVYLDYLSLSPEEKKEFLKKINIDSKQNAGSKIKQKHYTRRKSRSKYM